MALIDDMADVFEKINMLLAKAMKDTVSILDCYDAVKLQEAEEAKLTEKDLEDEASDYTVLDTEYEKETIGGWHLPENFDEWGQGYGRCGVCGTPWSIVRPGKGQPACNCGDMLFMHPSQSLPVEDEHVQKK